jgi:hypothetical protein
MHDEAACVCASFVRGVFWLPRRSNFLPFSMLWDGLADALSAAFWMCTWSRGVFLLRSPGRRPSKVLRGPLRAELFLRISAQFADMGQGKALFGSPPESSANPSATGSGLVLHVVRPDQACQRRPCVREREAMDAMRVQLEHASTGLREQVTEAERLRATVAEVRCCALLRFRRSRLMGPYRFGSSDTRVVVRDAVARRAGNRTGAGYGRRGRRP